MDRSEIITLVSYPREQDSKGVWRDADPVERNVYCQVDSVSRSEFFAAGQTGLKPEYRFTVFFAEYNGEKTVIYKGVYYTVYRTYHARTDALELYVERRVGTDGKNNTH